MNRKEIEYIKHCIEHSEFLTGGRGHSKTKQIIEQLQQENQQLKAENYRLEHNEKVLLQREGRAINYIDQVIMYKPCAREIAEELNVLIGILGSGNNE